MNDLLILGCSGTKRETDGVLPAFELYDGPYYRVLRKFLREYQWPHTLSISVLSARHALFGALKEIETYDERLTRATAAAMSPQCARVLRKWQDDHHAQIHIASGKDYRRVIEVASGDGFHVNFFDGGIGKQQQGLKRFLRAQSAENRKKTDTERRSGVAPRYFLPDWDDMLDPDFDFAQDAFSAPKRSERGDRHCNALIKTPMCDGILVSLAQRQTAKGPLRKLEGTEPFALTPKPLRGHFGLSDSQYLFGDCGAFSYAGEDEPTISTDQAIALYELYNFDFGTSVDHIPIKTLPEEERRARVDTTVDNARGFIEAWRKRGKLFTPVGAVQGTTPEQYAENIAAYHEMGYRHIAVGGLVPLRDAEIERIVRAVAEAANRLPQRPWIHLFGIYRPNLQRLFRELEIDSFDSATYFRKAWLRSDQNYLAPSGEWYAAIRVPMLSDGRTRKRLELSGNDVGDLESQERRALDTLAKYDAGEANIDETLDAVLEYDERLRRSSEIQSMRERYRRTLQAKPWLDCGCAFCQELGIHMLIFRGGNRNRRRGAHNTARLYGEIRRTR